jgi:hypothetical protein
VRLFRVSLHDVGPFHDAVLRFGTPESVDEPVVDEPTLDEASPDGPTDDELRESISLPAARPVTVLFGADGTGKTSVLSALALTRPGHALPVLPGSAATRDPGAGGKSAPYVAAEWLLGDDDPSRPHPLLVTSPSAVLPGESPEVATLRRREQAIFDRRAQHEGGYVFVSLSGARWFSRASTTLSVPEKSMLRYDVRQPNASFDDPGRADLARETKQTIAYAAISAALGDGRAEFDHLARFDSALREAIDIVLEPFDLIHAGVHPTSLEPQARSARGGLVPFDALPRAARHLISFVTLPLRALFGAYSGSESPREREGVVAIDDVEHQQDPSLLRALVPLLHRALPNVQWVLTTSSAQLALACDASSVIALRRTSNTRVELGDGQLH